MIGLELLLGAARLETAANRTEDAADRGAKLDESADDDEGEPTGHDTILKRGNTPPV
jgi:hypothetical protein